MRILDRYLIKKFLFPFICCMLTLILLYIIRDLIANLEDYVESSSFTPYEILKRYIISIPLIIVIVSPIANMLAVIYSLGNLSMHNEISAMRASGISISRILLPFILIGLLITLSIFSINKYLVQGSNSLMMQEMRNKNNSTQKAEGTVSNIFLYDKNRCLYNIKKFDVLTSEMKKIDIKYFFAEKEEKVIRMRIYADRGTIEGEKWILFSGRIENFNEEGRLDKANPGENFQSMELETGIDGEEVIQHKNAGNAGIFSPNIDKYHQASLPFINLVVIFLAVPFTINITKRGGAFAGIALSMIIFFSYYIIYQVSIAAGREGLINPVLSAWIPHIVFSAVGIGFLVKVRR